MLGSLRSKYRPLFLSIEDYHDRGIILSDDVLLNLEASVDRHLRSRVIGDDDQARTSTLPLPGIIPNYPIGEKIGEGQTSETFAFLEHLTPFPLVVQYHPMTTDETQHLAQVSSLLTQLYTLCPHLVLYLGYFLAPAGDAEEENISPQEEEDDPFSLTVECQSPNRGDSSGEEFGPYEPNFSTDDREETEDPTTGSEEHNVELSHDCLAFLYERIPITLDHVYTSFRTDPDMVRSGLAQLFFTLELFRRCGFNHGDINPGNIAWVKDPTWQGRNLLDYNYYAYIIGNRTYYLPSGPILRLLDYNLTSYDDGDLRLTPSVAYQDDFTSGLSLAKELLSSEDYEELTNALSKGDESQPGWIILFSEVLPQPGDKIILLGRLPELSSE